MIDIKELKYARNLKEAIECINDMTIRDEFEHFYNILIGNFQKQIEDNEEKFDNEYEQLDLDINRLIEENDKLNCSINDLYRGIAEISKIVNKLKEV